MAALLAMYGCGPVSAAKLAVAAGDNPGRLRSEASFAAICGACPIPASSGKTVRHRLNRGGDRQANSALHEIAVSVNIFFTIFTNVFSPIAPTRMRRIRQRGCAAFGV